MGLGFAGRKTNGLGFRSAIRRDSPAILSKAFISLTSLRCDEVQLESLSDKHPTTQGPGNWISMKTNRLANRTLPSQTEPLPFFRQALRGRTVFVTGR
jgi:hypothetical protein